jgi:hypothetical protein
LPALLLTVVLAAAERPNRQWEEQCDKRNIRHSAHMVTDTSPQLLAVPSYAYSADHPEFDVAKTPPTVDFAILQLTPEYLPDQGSATYGGWGKVELGPDGKYYFSEGNHMGYGGGTAFLFRYDPVTKTHEIVLNSQKVCGWSNDQFGDGKIHGDPNLSPQGDSWLLTFYGPYPKLADWGKNYFGGWLIHYNAYTNKAECLGRPVPDDSWPIFTWDWQRERLYAVGEWGTVLGAGKDFADWHGYGDNDYGKILVYDTKARKVLHGEVPVVTGSQPPDRIRWCRRALLLDRDTGILYGTESVPPFGFVKYDPKTQRFSRMKSTLERPLISWTKEKSRDGIFWIFDDRGNFYKFYPDLDQTELIGKNWRNGEDIENLRLSPGGRYVYYISASEGSGASNGFPVIQYDTRSGRKKVLAFLFDYYFEKYGYGTLCTYGFALSKDGSSLVAHVNGTFAPSRQRVRYGRPSVFDIHIPASERADDTRPPQQ